MGKKTKIGIVGYGNLGMALEQDILASNKYEIVAIFSKRNISSPHGTKVDLYSNIVSYVGQIDIMLLCGGSYGEQEEITKELLKNFDTIDCFDTHAKMKEYSLALNRIAKENKKVALFGCGWDPGLFSAMRCYFESISLGKSHTFWGKGLSQGHTNALKQISGVKDALQFTIPNKKILKKCKKDSSFVPPEKDKHSRLCYIVKEETASAKEIIKTVRQMPNYFEGYKVKIKFVSQHSLDKLKKDKSHRGQVFDKFSILGRHFEMWFGLELESNALFTARIMQTCINALLSYKNHKKYGAYSMLDIPPKMYRTQDDAIKLL